MAQFLDIPAPPPRMGASALFASGLGQGIAQGSAITMQSKMKQMFDHQEQDRSGKGLADFLVNSKILSPERRDEMAESLSMLPKELQGKALKQLLQYRDLGMMNEALSSLQSGEQPNKGGLVPGISDEIPEQVRQQAAPMYGITPKTRSLPPGKDFMLRYEDMPAENQIDHPRSINEPKTAISKTKMSPKQIYEGRKANLERVYNEYLPKFTQEGQKQWRGYYQDALKSLQQDRANDIAEQKMEQGARSLKLKEKTEATKKSVEEEQKQTQQFINESDEDIKKIPNLENMLKVAESSISHGNFGILSPDNIANVTGIEGFRTPQGESLRTAIKEYFLDDISRVGARPNMFIEQMLANILPTVGKNYKANMAWVETQRMKIDLVKHRNELIQQLKPKYLDQYGKPTHDLVVAVNNEMLKYGDRLQDKVSYRLQKNMEDDATIDDLQSMRHVTEGTPLTAKRASELLKMANGNIEDANLVAKKLGYKIIDRNLINDKP
jgi:hypothetical protein